MKTIVGVVLTLVAALAYGDGTTTNAAKNAYVPPKGAELKQAIKRASLRMNGGIVREKGSAKGWFVILNAQDIVPEKEFASVVDVIDKWMHLQSKIVKAEGVAVSSTKDAISKSGGVAGVAVVEQDGCPSLLTAPEEGWAIVNIKPLKVDAPKPEVLASRARKEILRAFALVTGGSFLATGDFVMRNVRTLAEIDALDREMFGAEVVQGVQRAAPRYGLVPWRQATYKKACMEGWAEPPTNKYQKAIWDDIHTLPTKPITIEKK